MAQRFGGRSGSVSVGTAVVLGLLLVAGGGAIDYGNATGKRMSLQRSLDAAALGAVSQRFDTPAERESFARSLFAGSPFCELVECSLTTATASDGRIELKASASVDTNLLALAGVEQIRIAATSVAVASEAGSVDVAMMLDFSGSMSLDNRFSDLILAGQRFLDLAESAEGVDARVGIVPFSEYVLAPISGSYVFDMANGGPLTGDTIAGCLTNRAYPFSVGSATPTASQEGSLWPVVDYTFGANPQGGTFNSQTTATQTSTGGEPAPDVLVMSSTHSGVTYETQYRSWTGAGGAPSFAGFSTGGADEVTVDGLGVHEVISVTPLTASNATITIVGSYTPGQPAPQPAPDYANSASWPEGDDSGLPPGFSQALLAEDLDVACVGYADRYLWLRPLSDNFASLKRAIGRMTPAGLTNIALSMDLGRYLLTENAPYADSGSDGRERVAILLTDGIQTVAAQGGDGAVSITNALSNIRETCADMREEGVTIFTIALAAPPEVGALMQDCAGDPSRFYEASGGQQLPEVFEAIFDNVVPVRARLDS